MMILSNWAAQWRIPKEALDDLRFRMGMVLSSPDNAGPAHSEARAQQEVRMEAAEKGILMFRNNVGALLDSSGRPVRYGLANDSKAMNDEIKSSDLIGCAPVAITPDMVGKTFGLFVAREVKKGDWKWCGDDHERAQLKFMDLIISHGGNAGFCTGRGTL